MALVRTAETWCSEHLHIPGGDAWRSHQRCACPAHVRVHVTSPDAEQLLTRLHKSRVVTEVLGTACLVLSAAAEEAAQ